ncbi:TonB-dependent receptor domain-containing protein [Parasedimentitalea huanghaiensis]|uniref:TonB-dependent receptor n=1 Tax=Parasedimentitalea huanghaiensis TaxID=2682100 RepID=A0A6L6WAH4_9RHOB|nr:TonB-dependent receptor [Zongyanglinia huanghaiensis]MVO14694.1 TonB-dependent receptor [Zongyanglinia huanghaiensis]
MRGHGLGWNLLGTVSSLSLMIVNAAPLMAQDVDEGFLGVIELGDSKREVQVGTATAVTVINQEEIDDRQAGTIAELIDSVPGVTLVNGNTPQGSGINIRGFGANGTYGTDAKVLVVVDGATTGAEELYRIGNQLFTDPELYSEVSVIRGTVGSFEFGSGVVGGVVQLETKNASDFTGGEIGVRLRQVLEATSNGAGFASSTIAAWQPTDNLEFLFNYTVRDQDDYKTADGTVVTNSKFRMPSYLVKGRYTFGDDNAHAITLSYNDSTTDEKDVPYDTFGTTGGSFGNVDRKTHSKIAVLQYDYNPSGNDLIDLSVNLSRSEQAIDQTCLPATAPHGCFSVVDADHNYETTKLTIKNTAYFLTGSVEHNLRAGIEFSQRDRLDAPSAPGGSDKRLALFAVDEILVNQNLTLTPALRYETQDIKGDTAPNNASYSNDALMGGLSARYEFDSGFAVFASAAYTEMMPIIDDLGTPLFMTQPEKSRTYEGGVSYTQGDLFSTGDALQVKANIYQTYVWDVTSYSNVANIDVKGIELEASYSHASGFYADFNATSADGTSTTNAGVDSKWIYAPETSARLTLGKRFGEALDVSWELVAAQSTTGVGNIALAGYGVNNLRATYRPQSGAFKGAEFRFGVENILDATYQSQLSTRVAPGRNFKLTMAKTF